MSDTTAKLLFGGTFDPLHHGHLIAAQAALEQTGAENVSFLPCYLPPHKIAPDTLLQHRLTMLQRALDMDLRFELDLREIAAGEPVYSVDTLRGLRAELGDSISLIWLIGWDSLKNLPHWYQWQNLLALANLAVVDRPLGEQGQQLPEAVQHLVSDRRETPENLHRHAAGKLAIIDNPPVAISSSDIRARLASGRSVRYLVPEAVYHYIEANGLYQGATA